MKGSTYGVWKYSVQLLQYPTFIKLSKYSGRLLQCQNNKTSYYGVEILRLVITGPKY